MSNQFNEYWKKRDLNDLIVRHFQEHCYAQREFAKKLGISLHQVRNLLFYKTKFFHTCELENFVNKLNEDQ